MKKTTDSSLFEKQNFLFKHLTITHYEPLGEDRERIRLKVGEQEHEFHVKIDNTMPTVISKNKKEIGFFGLLSAIKGNLPPEDQTLLYRHVVNWPYSESLKKNFIHFLNLERERWWGETIEKIVGVKNIRLEKFTQEKWDGKIELLLPESSRHLRSIVRKYETHYNVNFYLPNVPIEKTENEQIICEIAQLILKEGKVLGEVHQKLILQSLAKLLSEKFKKTNFYKLKKVFSNHIEKGE